MKIFSAVFLFLLTLSVPLLIFGQRSVNHTPWSVSHSDLSETFQQISLPTPDPQTLLEEDFLEDEFFRPERFALMVDVDVSPLSSGSMETIDKGRKIWRLKLSLQGSLASSLYFNHFKLPQGVHLYIYDQDKKEIKGAYTSSNNKISGLFATPLIYSDAVVVELNIPADLELGNWFSIAEMTYSYNLISDPMDNKGFGTSDFCEVNIACSPEGDDWQDEKRGVVKIQVKVNGAGYWCTGTMVNNTRNDNTPYLLTADHCAFKFGSYASTTDLGNWIFYFNYESDECEDPAFEPPINSLTGCMKVAHGGFRGLTGSDFYLVKLEDDIPADWNVYFNGWSAENFGSPEGVTIHHPDGDIKKISTYTDDLISTGWQGNGLQSHWLVRWVATQNNWGVTEGGSSGAPLYDPNGRIIGTLTGGLASCYNADDPDYYGKFSYHWESNGDDDTLQLKPWLDPDNTGILSILGATMGIDDKQIEKEKRMALFPNPVLDVLNIHFYSGIDEAFSIEIIDSMGKVKFRDDIEKRQSDITVNVRSLKPGIYFLRKSGRNEEVLRKFVKR